jgi:hypothetical protein
MAFFGKPKALPLDSLPDDVWSVSKGTNNGKPMLVRINTSVRQYAGHPELPHRLEIAIPLRAPNESGMPDNEEADQLGEIEERLFRAIGTSGRVVLVITTGGMREFVSYVGSPDEGARIFAAVRTGTTTHKVQHYVQADPKWEAYSQFA